MVRTRLLAVLLVRYSDKRGTDVESFNRSSGNFLYECAVTNAVCFDRCI